MLFSQRLKRMLTATLVAIWISSCSTEYKIFDPELSTTENLAVLSSLYDTYPCSQIIQSATTQANIVKHFDELMAKSANAFVNAIAYRPERSKALAQQRAAEQAMKRKGCNPDPAKVDVKPEAHHP
jgi:hypothetical protein